MLTVKVEDEIAAHGDDVWGILGDFGGVARWSQGISRCDLEGSGVGAVRTIEMNGIVIKERLEAFDPVTRKFSYAIVEGPLPLKNYLATVHVTDAGAGRARVEWSSEFEAVGMTDEQAMQLVESIYRQGIKGARKALLG